MNPQRVIPPPTGRPRSRPVLAAVLAAVVVAGLGVTGGPSYAGPALERSVLDPAAVAASIDYLTTTFKVSRAEALRRLDLQNDAQKLDGLLRRQQPGAYGGMWLDQDNGGVLVLQSTDSAATDPYVRRLADRRHVRTVHVARSLATLTAARDRLAKAVGAGPDAIYLPAIDETGNRVVLWDRTWVAEEKRDGTWDADSLSGKAWQTTLAGKAPRPAAATSSRIEVASTASVAQRGAAVVAETRVAADAVAAEGSLVVEQTLSRPHPMYTPYVDWGFCHPLYCSPGYGGMRGGLRLDVKRDNGSWGGCTSGFNVRSGGHIWNGWAWVITAGHCVVGKTNQTHIQHNGYDVLQAHGVERNSYPYDYTVLPYVDGNVSTSWLESQANHNLVMTYCRNGGQDSDSATPCGQQATSNNTPIRGTHSLDEITTGWIVCATGTGSSTVNYADAHPSGVPPDVERNAGYLVGTRCGKVTGKDVGINTDICARDGDSGGPLFSQLDFTAYGILEGSLQSRSGSCYAGEQNNYSPIVTILDDINYGYQDLLRNFGTTMGVILSSNG